MFYIHRQQLPVKRKVEMPVTELTTWLPKASSVLEKTETVIGINSHCVLSCLFNKTSVKDHL